MIHRIEQADDAVTIWRNAGDGTRYAFAELVGDTPSARAADLEARIQADLDVRIARRDLPADDPDRDADPARADLFWDGANLVSRSVVVMVTPRGDAYLLRFTNA